MKFIRIAAAAAAVLTAAAMVGCSSDSSNGGGGEVEVAETTVPIRLGIVPVTQTYWTLLAEEQGIFVENDLEVEITPLTNLANAIPGLGSQFDIVYGTHADLIQAAERGYEVTAISANYRESTEMSQGLLIAGKDSGIASVADFEGKRIGLPSLGGVIYAATLWAMANEGLSPEDVTIVEVPFPNMVDQLNGGQVDAVFATQPIVGAALAQGHQGLKNPFLEMKDPITIGMWLTTPEWAAANPLTVEAFRNSLTESVEWIHANDTEARALMSDLLGIPAPVTAVVPLPDWTTELTVADVELWIRILEETGQISVAPDPEPLVFTR